MPTNLHYFAQTQMLTKNPNITMFINADELSLRDKVSNIGKNL